MDAINWQDTPMDEFLSKLVPDGKGTFTSVSYPHGEGLAQSLMIVLQDEIEGAYEGVLSLGDEERNERTGEVPVLRDGEWSWVPHRGLTLRDVPAVLRALEVLEKGPVRLSQ